MSELISERFIIFFCFNGLKKTYLYITFLHNNTVEHISKAVLDSLHLKIGDLFDKETYSTCSAVALSVRVCQLKIFEQLEAMTH